MAINPTNQFNNAANLAKGAAGGYAYGALTNFVQTGYVDSKNDGFSSDGRSGFFQRGIDATKGQFAKYKDIQENPLKYTRDLENARNTEGDVSINGRRLPGIFQGFQISGGTYTEKFDQKKYRNKLVKLPKGSQLFQIDKGVRPIKGSASFVLLDDKYSTALQKAKEFVRQVTFWEDGENGEIVGLKRVFKIKSFLIGIDRAFNFETIKILDYSLDMSNQMAGRIDASFQFEQFSVYKDEFNPRRPLTGQVGDDAGNQINDLTTDENPVLETIETPSV